MWLRDEVEKQKKEYFDQEYSFAIASARSNSSLGSIDDWEVIRARMNRIYRDPNMHKTGFKGYGYSESINLQ